MLQLQFIKTRYRRGKQLLFSKTKLFLHCLSLPRCSPRMHAREGSSAHGVASGQTDNTKWSIDFSGSHVSRPQVTTAHRHQELRSFSLSYYTISIHHTQQLLSFCGRTERECTFVKCVYFKQTCVRAKDSTGQSLDNFKVSDISY